MSDTHLSSYSANKSRGVIALKLKHLFCPDRSGSDNKQRKRWRLVEQRITRRKAKHDIRIADRIA